MLEENMTSGGTFTRNSITRRTKLWIIRLLRKRLAAKTCFHDQSWAQHAPLLDELFFVSKCQFNERTLLKFKHGIIT
jgi:hypothetical protein